MLSSLSHIFLMLYMYISSAFLAQSTSWRYIYGVEPLKDMFSSGYYTVFRPSKITEREALVREFLANSYILKFKAAVGAQSCPVISRWVLWVCIWASHKELQERRCFEKCFQGVGWCLQIYKCEAGTCNCCHGDNQVDLTKYLTSLLQIRWAPQ